MGLPNSKLVSMRYVDQFSIDPSTGLSNNYYFRANSIYDPNYTGTGSQPSGHDEWSAFYKRYTVLGSKIKVTAWSSSSSLAAIVAISKRTDGEAVGNTSFKNILEQRGTHYKPLAPLGSDPTTASVFHTFSAKRFFGMKDLADNSECSAAFGADPAQECYYQVNLCPVNDSDDLPATYFTCTIDYIVLLRDPIPLSNS